VHRSWETSTYVPILFHYGRKVGKEQRLLLELYGLLLSRVQGRMPVNGIAWHGRECKAKRVRLNLNLRQAEQLLRDVKEMPSSASPPRLLLNDHCQVCEFRQRCRQQVMQEDNLILLRGISEREVKGYARKGILTVKQLAHTFTPPSEEKEADSEDRPPLPFVAGSCHPGQEDLRPWNA
jgi:predicted RecB family nuclease